MGNTSLSNGGRLNLLAAVSIARRLGCSVRVARRTGEYKIYHPLMGTKAVTVSVTRHECSARLMMWLRRIEKESFKTGGTQVTRKGR